MSAGEVMARLWPEGQPVRLRWDKGVFAAVESAGEVSPDVWAAPALVDLQINGYAGIDFQQDGLTMDELVVATRELRKAGCERWLLTLITDEWAKLTSRLRHLRVLRAQSAELESAIAGWHVEGPFLSAEPGFRGAHDATVMCDPTAEHIRELREITGTDPVLLTLAPERQNAIEVIALAVSLGMKVSLGHTNATGEVLRQAIEAGASGFTHLANGCPRDLDRHDNILWRVFDLGKLTISLIPDAIHVSPALFRLMHRIVSSDSIYYTTDAMAAAGAPPGKYTIGRLQLEVGADQIVRLPGTPNFAGSALRPVDGIVRAAEMLGCGWQSVWEHFSTAPARFMGLAEGEIKVGEPATFCLVQTEGEEIESVRTFVGGVERE